MRKNMTDEELLEKLGQACIEVENTPMIESNDLKNRYLNEIAKNKKVNPPKHKLFFTLISSALTMIILITCLFIFLPNESMRYSDIDENVDAISITNEDFIDSVPEKYKFLIEINSENINCLTLYKSQAKTLACKIDYSDESYLFVTFSKNFIFSYNEKFNNETTKLTKYNGYDVYETNIEVNSGRKTKIDYYLWIHTQNNDYYLNIKNSTTEKQDSFKEKIFENI